MNCLFLAVMADLEQLVGFGQANSFENLEQCVRAVADKVHQLKSHSNITLTNDALRAWQNELAERTIVVGDLNVVRPRTLLCILVEVVITYKWRRN